MNRILQIKRKAKYPLPQDIELHQGVSVFINQNHFFL